jgi:hypothetical protein
MHKASISLCQMVIIQVKRQMSICSFLRDMGTIDTQSIKFHFDRGDFQKWLKNTIGDDELARIIYELDKKISEEDLGRKVGGHSAKKNFRIAVDALKYPYLVGLISAVSLF